MGMKKWLKAENDRLASDNRSLVTRIIEMSKIAIDGCDDGNLEEIGRLTQEAEQLKHMCNRNAELANRYKGELEEWTNRCVQAEGRRDELEATKKQLEDKINSCLVFRYGDYTIIDTLERDVSALEDLLDNKTPHHLEKTRLGGKIEGVKLAIQKIKEYQKIEVE
jgi:hypothetical protein